MLDRLLEKLNAKYENLTPEEKKTYEAWAKTLSRKDVTLDDVKMFVKMELARSREELAKWDNTPARELFYKSLVHLTETLNAFIATPGAERDALRNHLREVFHIDV
jgi:hypothetical protein